MTDTRRALVLLRAAWELLVAQSPNNIAVRDLVLAAIHDLEQKPLSVQ